MSKFGNEHKIFYFSRRKYGSELLIDMVRLESIVKYIQEYPIHSLNYYDITLIQSGSGEFALNGQHFPIEENQLFFTARGQVREWSLNETPSGMVVFFEEEFLCSFFSDPMFVKNLSFFRNKLAPPQLTLNTEQANYFTNLLVQIEQEITANKETHLLRALLYQSLAWLNNLYRTNYQQIEKPQNMKVSSFIKLVETNFRKQHSTTFYASELCITSGYLNEVVKNAMGISAKQYIKNRIITEARRLLQFSDDSVLEIAWKLGFEDPSYFVRLFRTETGTSPLAFRKNFLP
jgi:AraC-type DNA-binding domain-containing proteins